LLNGHSFESPAQKFIASNSKQQQQAAAAASSSSSKQQAAAASSSSKQQQQAAASKQQQQAAEYLQIITWQQIFPIYTYQICPVYLQIMDHVWISYIQIMDK
jgi:sortase (surface protein transpeptidase)